MGWGVEYYSLFVVVGEIYFPGQLYVLFCQFLVEGAGFHCVTRIVLLVGRLLIILRSDLSLRLAYVDFAGTILLYCVYKLMLLHESIRCGNDSDSWMVPRRIFLLHVNPMIYVVSVARVQDNLFLGEPYAFYYIQMRHLRVRMQIVVVSLILVSLGWELVEIAGIFFPKGWARILAVCCSILQWSYFEMVVLLFTRCLIYAILAEWVGRLPLALSWRLIGFLVVESWEFGCKSSFAQHLCTLFIY